MGISHTSEPVVLTEAQSIPEVLAERPKDKPRDKAAAMKRRTPSNPRDLLWHCEDPILGLNEELIESHAHAYQLNGQIRQTSTFEAFLRTRLTGGAYGLNGHSAQ